MYIHLHPLHCHVVRRYFWRWLCERERERGDMNKSIKCILQTARKFRHWLFCFTQNARTPQPERKINEPNNFLLSVKIAQQYPLKYHFTCSVLGTRCGISHFIWCVCVCVIHPCITYYFLIIISSVYARLVRQWSEVATIEGYIQYIQIPKVYLCMWLRAEYHICVSTSPTHGNWATLRLTSLLLSSTYGHFHL